MPAEKPSDVLTVAGFLLLAIITSGGAIHIISSNDHLSTFSRLRAGLAISVSLFCIGLSVAIAIMSEHHD